MKKKILVFAFIILSFFPLSTFAAVDWNTLGYEIVAKGEENDIVLQKGSWRFLLVNESEVTQQHAEAIGKMNELFASWTFIKVRNLKYVITPTSIDVFVIPRSFDYNGKSYMDNVGAGLQFIYSEEAMRYSFRIKRGDMFLKISGVYIEEEVLTKKIEEAIADPRTFIQRRDADYLLNKVERLEEKMDTIAADNIRVRNEVRQLSTTVNQTANATIKTRNAVVAYNNNRLFYGAKPIPQEKIIKILQMRKNNPSASIDDLMKKFNEIDYKVTRKEVEIVLQAYNNEFKKE